MMFTETLSQAVDRLTAQGYTDDFRAESDGMRAVVAGILYRPELLVVEEIVRFEGISDPADEAIVLALHCREDGIKGVHGALRAGDGRSRSRDDAPPSRHDHKEVMP